MSKINPNELLIAQPAKPAAPVGMHARRSLEVYPRMDNIYKGKSSFNFDMMRTKIFEVRRGAKEELWLWFAHGLTGIIVGVIAFLMALVEDKLTR